MATSQRLARRPKARAAAPEAAKQVVECDFCRRTAAWKVEQLGTRPLCPSHAGEWLLAGQHVRPLELRLDLQDASRRRQKEALRALLDL